jgi:Xaa-Pro dipeptidase
VFDRAEFDARIAKTRAAMAAASVDLLLIDSAELLAWLTGYTVSETLYRAAFLPRDGEAWFVLRALDEAPCRERTWIREIVGFADIDSPHAVIADSIRRRGYADVRMGADFDSYGFSAGTHARLSALLPQMAIVDLPGISDSLRWVKSAAEIAVIARAADIADKAMAAIKEKARAGMTTRDAAGIAAAIFLREGADTGEVGPIVKSRGNHEFLHGAFRDEVLKEGDILHVELIPRVDNYSARLMRPIVIGRPPEGVASAAAQMITLQEAQITAMTAGAKASAVDAILRNGLIAAGLRPDYLNVTAYTLGLYARTPRPSDFSRVFLPTSDWPLEAGMVFHLYATACGIGFSETVLVGTEGGRRLTNAPRCI